MALGTPLTPQAGALTLVGFFLATSAILGAD
jgi:hypothetical protein